MNEVKGNRLPGKADNTGNTEKWKQQIAECRNSGLSVKEWCLENKISKDAYYAHMKKVREKASEEIEIVPIQNPDLFSDAVCIHIISENINIEINGSASPEQLTAIVSSLKRC